LHIVVYVSKKVLFLNPFNWFFDNMNDCFFLKKNISFFLVAVCLVLTSGNSVYGRIYGSYIVCSGATISLTDTVAGSIVSWVSSDTTVASVGATSGIVHVLNAGTALVRYIYLSNPDAIVSNDSFTITVLAVPNAGAITGYSSVCVGNRILLTDSIGTGTWSVSGNVVGHITDSAGTGFFYGWASGIDTVRYTVTNSACSASASKVIAVQAVPSPGTIWGNSNICAGVPDTLTDTTATVLGTWHTSGGSAGTVSASGIYVGRTVGVDTVRFDTVYYKVANACRTDSQKLVIRIYPAPSIKNLADTSLCSSTMFRLNPTFSFAGYVYFSWRRDTVAGIMNTGSGTGLINEVLVNDSNTSKTVVYRDSLFGGGCPNVQWQHVTVKPLPNSGIIMGPASICPSTVSTYSDTVSGGVWNTALGNLTITTHPTNVTLSGASPGYDTLKYTVSNGSCLGTAARRVTVLPAIPPYTGTILGNANICAGVPDTLRDTAAVAAGTWSISAFSRGTISANGIFTGSALGIDTTRLDTVFYRVTNTCGVDSQKLVIRVYPAPRVVNAPDTNICSGSIFKLNPHFNIDGYVYFTWRLDTATGIDSISRRLNTVGTSRTTVMFRDSVYAGGCSNVQYQQVTIKPLPVAGSIAGVDSVCAGSSIILTDTTSGGYWLTSNAAVAAVVNGTVTGIVASQANISYAVPNDCGTAYAIHPVTVNPLPDAGEIFGVASLCIGGNITLSETSPGGTWSSANTLGAVVNNGIVTGMGAGTTIINYNVVNNCGSATAFFPVNVGTVPDIGLLSGASFVCAGNVIVLADTFPGGVWSSQNTANSTVSDGVVTGIAPGLNIISYIATNYCGASVAVKPVLTIALPNAGTISGAPIVCIGIPDSLTDSISGGLWSIQHPGITTITDQGILSGLATGNDTVFYRVSNLCGTAVATFPVTIGQLPNPGTITGPSDVCIGRSISLTDSVTGGVWESSNNTFATVSSGTLVGINSGTDTVVYSFTNLCGTASVSKTVYVHALPDAGSISGITTVCVGSTVLLTDTIQGGIWSSTDTTIATISNGMTMGNKQGIVFIKYSVSNSCGSDTSVQLVNVFSLPNAGVVSGASEICVGNSATLLDAAAGGTWSSDNKSVAVVNNGIVHGLSVGTTSIKYTVGNFCGTKTATHLLTVFPMPNAGKINGPEAVCIGGTITLSDSVAGGVWVSSNASVASVADGVVVGISDGTDTIRYVVATGCGSKIAQLPIFVGVPPNPGVIIGAHSLCESHSIALSESVTGGIWISSNPSICSVDNFGVLTGKTSGTAIISYQVLDTCGSAVALDTVVVESMPDAGVIVGGNSLCIGAAQTLSETVVGGTWSAQGSHASIAGNGIVTGISVGTEIISYSLSNSCGSKFATDLLIVDSCSESCFTTVFAGDTVSGYSGDGGPANLARFNQPVSVAADKYGNVYIADCGNSCIRKVWKNARGTNIVETVAGSPATSGYFGDGGPAKDAILAYPTNIAISPASEIFFFDSGNAVIRKISSSGIITTIVGNSIAGSGFSGDGGNATDAQISSSCALAFDAVGNLLIADAGNSCIRKVNLVGKLGTGIITTIAGIPRNKGFSVDGGPAFAAKFNQPNSLVADAYGNIYIADAGNSCIREITTAGNVVTIAGIPNSGGYAGDGGAAVHAKTSYPAGIAIDTAGVIYFADRGNNRIRSIKNGHINTVVGTGIAGFNGEGYGPATDLNGPSGIFVVSSSQYFIADRYNNLVRQVSIHKSSSVVPDETTDDIKLVPNPSGGEFVLFIGRNADEEVHIRINNMFGNTVYTNSVHSNTNVTMNLHLPEGMYFVYASSSTHNNCRKMIIIQK
jgi:Secretion system C-terminal sorting domain/NHL repeat